jgi:hypothetical protein
MAMGEREIRAYASQTTRHTVGAGAAFARRGWCLVPPYDYSLPSAHNALIRRVVRDTNERVEYLNGRMTVKFFNSFTSTAIVSEIEPQMILKCELNFADTRLSEIRHARKKRVILFQL